MFRICVLIKVKHLVKDATIERCNFKDAQNAQNDAQTCTKNDSLV